MLLLVALSAVCAAAQKPAAAKLDDKGADDLLEGILEDLDPSKPSPGSAKLSTTNTFARTRPGPPAVTKTFSRGGVTASRGSGGSAAGTAAAAGSRGFGGSAGGGLGSGGSSGGMGVRSRRQQPQQQKQQQQPTQSFSFGGAHHGAAACDEDESGGVDDSHAALQQRGDDEAQEFSFALPGETGCMDVRHTSWHGGVVQPCGAPKQHKRPCSYWHVQQIRGCSMRIDQ